jgi:superfamily II DNA or RNA helicase
MAVDIAKHFKRTLFIAHREELIHQAYNDLDRIMPMNVGIVKGKTFEIDKRVVVASVQTLYNRLDRIDPNSFDHVIVDECFPAGTLIDKKPIENYKPGDIIDSFNHNTNQIEKKKILRSIKNPAPNKLYDFGEFSCTANHPIFIVGIGYCTAKEIYYAYIYNKMMCYGQTTKLLQNLYKLWDRFHCKDKEKYLFGEVPQRKDRGKKILTTFDEMLKLWKRIQFQGIRKEPYNLHGFSTKRFWMLFRKMQKGIFQQSCFTDNEGNEYEICIKTDEREQSNVKSGNKRKNDKISSGENVLISRRKREIDKTATHRIEIDKTSNGIRYLHIRPDLKRKESSKSLQSRSRLSGSKIINRNRREISPLKTLEILRQTKDGSIKLSRLDCNKIYKRKSRRGFSKSERNDYVYNLEVEGNNNYFAEGILVHNCHHYVSPSFLKAVRHFKPKLLTAWTATPKRLDGISLSNLVQEIVFEYRIEDGIKDGYLAPIEAYQIKTQTDLSQVKKVAGDFNQKELSEKVDSQLRNDLIVAKYLEYSEGKQAIGFCVDIQHCYNLRECFRERNINCEVVVSDPERCPNRTELIKDFSNGKITVLLNVMILTEGFDYSDVGCVIMGRPTQSETVYIQSVGRGTRLKSENFKERFNTDKCTILDFVDNTGNHSLVNSWELEKDKDVKDKVFIPEEHREKLLEVEKERREARIKVMHGKDKKIDLLRLPVISPWNSAKMEELATEKQIAWIKQVNLYQEGIEYTKAMASEIISGLPAKEWQINFLASNGYDVSGGATQGQFQRVKYLVEQRNKYQMTDAQRKKYQA